MKKWLVFKIFEKLKQKREWRWISNPKKRKNFNPTTDGTMFIFAIFQYIQFIYIIWLAFGIFVKT